MKARTKVAEALSLIVRQRRKERGSGDKKNDMLEALLGGDDGFSDEEIVDFMVALLVAGYETTSTIMTLAVKFLTETPLALGQLKVFSISSILLMLLFSVCFRFIFFEAKWKKEKKRSSSLFVYIRWSPKSIMITLVSLETSFSLSINFVNH